MARKAPQVADLEKHAEAWAGLKAALVDMGEDADDLHDTLAGEVDLIEALTRLDYQIIDAEIEAEGTKTIIAALTSRKGRADRRAEALRAIVLQAMEIAGEKKLNLPTGTLSVRVINPKLIVTDEAALPAIYFKTPDPVLDKAALKLAWDELPEGQTIEGVSLDNGGVGLTIRRA